MCSGFIDTDESASDFDPCKKMKYGRSRVTRKKGKDYMYCVNANPICHFFEIPT